MTDIPPHKDTQQYLLGIDSGLTITKAAIFTIEGRQIGVGSTKPHTYTPNPRWVEHDMAEVWEACVQAIRQAMENAGIDGSQIVGVGATAHGDGIYLIDENGEPVRRGITSLDSRAWEIMEKWRGDSRLMRAALEITGQQPLVANPTALLAWIKLNHPPPTSSARRSTPRSICCAAGRCAPVRRTTTRRRMPPSSPRRC